MKNNIDIFHCPTCHSELEIGDEVILCNENNHRFDIVDDIPLMFVEGGEGEQAEIITQKVKQFYETNPFPNYDETDNPGLLISKAESTVFAKMLNDELQFNIRVLEVGCGTGQLTNYLSLAHRYTFGVDLSLNSLLLASKFKNENLLKRSSFYQMNLFKPIFKEETFNVIICNGVLHHTHEAYKGLRSVSKLLKKGGYLLIGLYNRYGRLFTNIRRKVFNLTGNRFHSMDAYLKRTDINQIKKQTWYLDQYENPHETTHTFGEVLRWFDKTGLEFISSVPEIGNILALDENYKLFSKKSSGNILSRLLTQIAMPFLTNKEGGFFIMIGRKK